MGSSHATCLKSSLYWCITLCTGAKRGFHDFQLGEKSPNHTQKFERSLWDYQIMPCAIPPQQFDKLCDQMWLGATRHAPDFSFTNGKCDAEREQCGRHVSILHRLHQQAVVEFMRATIMRRCDEQRAWLAASMSRRSSSSSSTRKRVCMTSGKQDCLQTDPGASIINKDHQRGGVGRREQWLVVDVMSSRHGKPCARLVGVTYQRACQAKSTMTKQHEKTCVNQIG